ncbi:hypothetical protein [Xanthomonas sp. 10-10]|uniref:Uncharacterized protein n=1 Tax=Xanthomonas sp. 10-10 TaxID=3115848 RepID=A0AAU7P8P0_9XANT
MPAPRSALSTPRRRHPASGAISTKAACDSRAQDAQDDGDAYVLVQGERHLMHGTTDDLQTARRYTNANGWVLWFRANGVQYVVRDPGLLHRLRTGYARSLQLRAAQDRLQARQQALAAQLAASAVGLPAASEATAAQPAQGAASDTLEQQRLLTQRQAVLASKQAGATRLATRQALSILREALASGRATRVTG